MSSDEDEMVLMRSDSDSSNTLRNKEEITVVDTKLSGSEIVLEQEESDSLQELPEKKYEYLDHTSDVQIHAWGETLEEAFEQCAMGMFGYMTDIESVNNIRCEEILVQAEDLESLLFRFLDEFLFLFSAEPYFIARKVKIMEFDRNTWKIKAKGYGETFDLLKHPQGTEVKAITYSNMQIHEENNAIQVFVIIDI